MYSRRDHEAARHRLAGEDLQAELGRLLAGARREGDRATLLVLDDPLHPAVVLVARRHHQALRRPASSNASATPIDIWPAGEKTPSMLG